MSFILSIICALRSVALVRSSASLRLDFAVRSIALLAFPPFPKMLAFCALDLGIGASCRSVATAFVAVITQTARCISQRRDRTHATSNEDVRYA